MFLPLVAAGPAAALSGYATDQPAVNAQYPDADTGGPKGAGGNDGTLRSLMVSTGRVSRHRLARSPKALARQRQVQRRIVRQERGALSSAAVEMASDARTFSVSDQGGGNDANLTTEGYYLNGQGT